LRGPRRLPSDMTRTAADQRQSTDAPTPAASSSRAQLAQALRDAAVLRGIDGEAIAWLDRKLAEQSFNLVVAGQFKRGKSSVINSLLGDRLLPVGVIPLTSVVTLIRSGTAPRGQVEFLDGRTQELLLETLAEFVTERGNPKNAKGVRQVIIEHPSAWLADGVQLIDTPGIGSVYQHNTDVTQQYLPKADAVLLIASVDQPVSCAELEFLAGIRQYAGKVFCLLNKIDYVQKDELAEAVRFAREAIRSALETEVPIFAVSARLALDSHLADGKSSVESGFPDFEYALHRFMTHERRTVWIHSVARSLLRILAQARFALELEAKILTTPLSEIEDKLAAYEAKKREFERALRDYQVLMDSGARALVKDEIEPALEKFKLGERTRICALVEEWSSAESAALPVRKLDAMLEQRSKKEIRSAYDGWLAREDVAASAAFEKLCGRFWAEMQSSVDELVRYSSELFAVRFEAVPDDSRWSPESGFYYKFWYEPPGLATLASSLVAILPRFLAAKLILRRWRAQALELVEVQAGRLRYDFEQRVQKSAQDARGRMVRRIQATLAGIEAAIEGAATARRQGAEQVSAGMARIKLANEAMSSIEARVRAVSPAG
jgi:GTP-binding protein EngB required for normal cell division